MVSVFGRPKVNRIKELADCNNVQMLVQIIILTQDVLNS